nr:MAG TPA: hypothetical protein [Caudoviricetes sp.]
MIVNRIAKIKLVKQRPKGAFIKLKIAFFIFAGFLRGNRLFLFSYFLKRLFAFCAIFEMGWELFNFAGIYGANPRWNRLAISPAPGAIQQQPEPLDSPRYTNTF